jgi:hypothetical protein
MLQEAGSTSSPLNKLLGPHCQPLQAHPPRSAIRIIAGEESNNIHGNSSIRRILSMMHETVRSRHPRRITTALETKSILPANEAAHTTIDSALGLQTERGLSEPALKTCLLMILPYSFSYPYGHNSVYRSNEDRSGSPPT